MACVLQILEGPGRRHVGHRRVLRLERPADERREAAGFVLQLPQALQVLDALGQRLDVAEHHRAGRSAAQLVPDAMDFQPFVGQALVDGHGLADAIDEDLAAAAGQTAEAGFLEPAQHFAQRQLVDLVEVPDLRRTEGVQIELRIARLEIAQQLLVPLQLQTGMHCRPASASDRRPARSSPRSSCRSPRAAGRRRRRRRSCGRRRRNRRRPRRRWCN